ncbi:MAG: RDD family protein, partial [Candidatus Eremiobacteraeota bacterium]|nr:RDD family protein [Candidatus Eremiobacteraeota bacterium]
DAAIKAIAIASFHHLGREVDLAVVAEQLRELRSEPTLRAGEWLASSPYAARRIADLVAFAPTPLAQRWIARFAQGAVPMPRRQIETTSNRVYAGWWRRAGAWLIDFSIVLAITPALKPIVNAQENGVNLLTADQFARMPLLVGTVFSSTALVWLWIYTIVLVMVIGRTVGMMIVDVRVVRGDFTRPTVWNAVVRYALAALSLMTVFPLVVWGLRRVQPYERLSGTRLVSASAALVQSLPQQKGATT